MNYGFLEEYIKLVKSTAFEFRGYTNSMFDLDDYEQELWIKIFSMVLSSKHNERKKWGFIKASLRNHLTDIVRYSTRRNNIVPLAEDYECEYNISSTESFHEKELYFLLKYLSVKYGGDVQRYIENALNPSPIIRDRWECACKSCRRLTHYIDIPPFTLGEYLGLTKKQVYKIIICLKKELYEIGYYNPSPIEKKSLTKLQVILCNNCNTKYYIQLKKCTHCGTLLNLSTRNK